MIATGFRSESRPHASDSMTASAAIQQARQARWATPVPEPQITRRADAAYELQAEEMEFRDAQPETESISPAAPVASGAAELETAPAPSAAHPPRGSGRRCNRRVRLLRWRIWAPITIRTSSTFPHTCERKTPISDSDSDARGAAGEVELDRPAAPRHLCCPIRCLSSSHLLLPWQLRHRDTSLLYFCGFLWTGTQKR